MDAHLFSAIKKNQFPRKEGRDDVHFVDALEIVLNDGIHENYKEKLEAQMEKGAFSFTKKVLEAVQIKKQG